MWSHNALPVDAPDRVDGFGNRFSFERVDGTEYLRKIVLNGPADGGMGGAIEINGVPGLEYMTAWNGPDDLSYISFEGTDATTQTIESASISMPYIKRMAQAYPARFEYGAAEDLFRIGYPKSADDIHREERRWDEDTSRDYVYGIRGGMFQAVSEFEQIFDHFNVFDYYGTQPRKLVEFDESIMGSFMNATFFNINSGRAEFNFDASRIRFDKDFPYNDRDLEGIKSIVYRPYVQPTWFFAKPEPALVVEFASGDIVVWKRDESDGNYRSLVLDVDQSVRSDKMWFIPFVRTQGRDDKDKIGTLEGRGWVDDILLEKEHEYHSKKKREFEESYFRSTEWQQTFAMMATILGSITTGISAVNLNRRAFRLVGIRTGSFPKSNFAAFMAASFWGFLMLRTGRVVDSLPATTNALNTILAQNQVLERRINPIPIWYLAPTFRFMFKLVEYNPYM